MKHSLTNKDKVALTADCSVCGPAAAIAKNGRYGFVCRVGRKEAGRRYKRAHPDRVREAKNRPVSSHRLTNRDGSPDVCAICGPVEPVVMGRGWGCPNRAKELGWKVFSLEPQPRCPICTTFLDRLGSCKKCDDDMTDLDTAFMPAESRPAQRAFRQDVGWLEGFSVLDPDSPHLIASRTESVVPGWKTLGASSAGGDIVRSDYAALYGSGSR